MSEIQASVSALSYPVPSREELLASAELMLRAPDLKLRAEKAEARVEKLHEALRSTLSAYCTLCWNHPGDPVVKAPIVKVVIEQAERALWPMAE